MFLFTKKRKEQKGFTLIELMLVVSMIAMLSAMTIPISFGSLKKQSVEEEASQLLSVLRQTQAKSMKGRDDSLWGVYFTPETYTSFKGNSYEERDPLYDEVFELYSDISIAGVPEIVFDNSGKPQIEGLVGHWTMNEGEGGVVHDLSLSKYHRNFSGTHSWIDGIGGGAMHLEMSDTIEFSSPEHLDFQPMDSFSMGGWVKVEDVQIRYPDGHQTSCFIGRGHHGGSVGIGIYAFASEGEFYSMNVLAGSRAVSQISNSYNIDWNKYYHVFFVYTPGMQYTYVDGILRSSRDNSAGLSGSFSGNWGIFRAAAVPGGNSAHMQGEADDVRIYNRALSPEEIRLIYESGLDGVDDNIIELSDGSDSVKINVGRQGRIEVVR